MWKKGEERKRRKKGLEELLAPKRGISFKLMIYRVDLVPVIQSKMNAFFIKNSFHVHYNSTSRQEASASIGSHGSPAMFRSYSVIGLWTAWVIEDRLLVTMFMKTCLPIQVQLRFPPFPPAWPLENFATADPRSWRSLKAAIFVICQGACCELLDHV